ncbi:ATP-binding cassette domain-containing protein [Leifsonia sp. YIM 134122]|uniref:ATP-binding cassette domain-containing protein n=1 Tax=Leifsonia stereocauli TaxID=3134136 RepID=A0ABU9W0U7_9MICO
MSTVLEFDDVTVAYPRPHDAPLILVSGCDITVRPGRLHCVAGRSGSGKTSILRVAAGLVAPSEGRVLWDGLDLAGVDDDAVTRLRRDRVGFLDQAGSLLDGMSVLENVLVPAVPARRVRELGERALALLDEVGIADRASARPAELSGGERQRAALARALLLSPQLLIVDEPTAALDRASADGIIDLLVAQRDADVAVLVASHDPHLIDAADARTHLA